MNTFSPIDPKKLFRIEHFDRILATIDSLYLDKYKRQMKKDALAAELSGTGVSVKKSWIDSLRRGHAIHYVKAKSVLVATNNFLSKLGGPQIPERALVEAGAQPE